MTVTSLADIQRAGRYLLLPGQQERIWDLCSGIGCFLLGSTKASLQIQSYSTADINQRASGVLRSNLPLFKHRRGHCFEDPSELELFEDELPRNLFALRQRIARILQDTPSDQLPTLIAITAPCTEGSCAGLGMGPMTEKGQVFLAGLEVTGAVLDEYRRRNLTPQHGDRRFAPCGWLFETAPLQSSDDRPGVQELREIYNLTMGDKAIDNAGLKGSAAHRVTEMYTNLGNAADWSSIGKRGRQEPIVPLQDILWQGERMQEWNPRIHGTPRFPDREGHPPARYPKHVRSEGSHNWRAQKLSPQQQTEDARKGDPFSGREHAIGVSVFNGRLKVPTSEQIERSMGLPEGYTAFTTLRSATGLEVLRCTETERHGLLGDIFDPNLIAATLKDRQLSSIKLAAAVGLNWQQQPSTGSQPHRQQNNTPPQTSANSGRHQVAEPAQVLPHQSQASTKPASSRAAQPPDKHQEADGRASITIEAKQQFCPWDPTWHLGESFAKEGVVPCLPAHPAERLKAASGIPPPLDPGSESDLRASRQYAFAAKLLRMRETQEFPPEAFLPDREFKQFIIDNLINDPKDFKPGNIHRHAKYWDLLLKEFTPDFYKSRKGKAVMRIISKGIKPNWVHINDPAQQQHPHWAENLAAVKRMLLANNYTQAEIDKLLAGPEPGQIRLANHNSVFEHSVVGGQSISHEAYVDEQTKILLQLGIIVEWWWPDGKPPTCVNPIGVINQGIPAKLRMILDCRFPNLWVPYIPFSYESLEEFRHHIQPGAWLSVSDFKWGYFHMAIQPGLVKYNAFYWKGRYYAYAVSAFGVASAPYLFTLLTQATFLPARRVGIDILSYIDDRMSSTLGQIRAKFDTLLQFAMMVALGWFVSPPKCIISPEQLAKFLGISVDTVIGQFRVPEEKLQAMLAEIDGIVAQLAPKEHSTIAKRRLASIAGKVMSAKLALPLAPLLCDELFRSLSYSSDWNSKVQVSEYLKQALPLLAKYMRTHNGGPIWKRPGGITFAGDAGEKGAGGFTISGELRQPVQVSYTPEQEAAITTHEFHSTRREICMAHWALHRCLEVEPAGSILRCGGNFTYITDSQANREIILGMRPTSRQTRQQIFDLWWQAVEHGVHLQIIWVPRYASPMPLADLHSNMTDNTAWGLKSWAFSQVLRDLDLQPEQIQLDPFSQADFAKASRWFSLYEAPGSAGVNGLLQSWKGPQGEKLFCFVNGPFNLMPEIITKIRHEQADCVLIYPAWNKPWQTLLCRLPITKTASVKKRNAAGGNESPFQPGSRVDSLHRSMAQHWTTYAALIRWGAGDQGLSPAAAPSMASA